MSTAPALPGITPARQPYPGGSERHVPIVPHVLIIGERKGYYLPPPITRAETVYDTPTTVRVRLPDGRQTTEQQHKVWAVPDDAAWAEIEAAVQAFGARLAELADVLRRLGRYAERLAVWKDAKTTPNPLCPAVARIDDPDVTGTNWWLTSWHVPRLERRPVVRHTAKMLTGDAMPNAYFFTQAGSFVLADDADWAAVEAAHAAAEQAVRDAEALLNRLGTYQDALDGRHAARSTGGEQGAQALAAGTTDAAEQLLEQAGKALIVSEPAVEGHLVMSREEAERAAAAIVAAVENLRQLIDEFDRGRGWQTLGFESFRAWAVASIPDTNLRYVYRLRDANEVDRSLGVAIGHTPESHARELKHVPPAERQDVMRQADALAQEAGRPRQASDVRQVAQERVANGNTPALPAPLAAVAEALRRGGPPQTAYNAVHAVPLELRDRAYAAVDARVEGRPLEDALAILAGSTATSEVVPSAADLEARERLIARAAAAGYTLTWSQRGGARFTQTATGAPFGGARNLEEAEERVAGLERQAAGDAREARGLARVPYEGVEPPPEWDAWRTRVLALGGTLTQSVAGTLNLALPGHPYLGGRPSREWDALCAQIAAAEGATAAPPPAARGSEAERSYERLEVELAGDLERLGSDGVRRLAVLIFDDPHADGESLWEYLTGVARERPDLVTAALEQEVPS